MAEKATTTTTTTTTTKVPSIAIEEKAVLASTQEPSKVDQLKEKLPSGDEIKEQAEELKTKAVDAWDHRDDLQRQARERLEHANHVAVTFIQDQPILALGAAVGIGYLVGRVASRRWIT